ncbi:MAG: SpoIIE family protein phosphatase [Thermoanaerobaculaceae bacterium]
MVALARLPVRLVLFGAGALLVTLLSLLDMFLPRPWDGVVLSPDRERLLVQSVLVGTGGYEAGLRPGDRIVGVGRMIVRSPGEVARVLASYKARDEVPYLVSRDGQLLELSVRLSSRRLSTPLFVYAAVCGFFFFAVGLYVLLSRPDDAPAAPSRVFFILCTLFLLFLVCRLRPASYSFFDGLILTTGTLSLMALPAAFLHFFLVFPKRQTFTLTSQESGTLARLQRFINTSPRLFLLLYALPPLTYVVTMTGAKLFGWRVRTVSGAPVASWVLLGDYLVLGLLALLRSLLTTENPWQKRQLATVFAGNLVGVVPFLFFAVVLPSFSQSEASVALAVVSLLALPLAFAYAIVRFQLLDVRLVVRRSLLYTLTTASLTAVYALALAATNALARTQGFIQAPYFPLIFALLVVALFDPLRKRIQGPVDRFFFRDMVDARRALEELSEALAREFSLARLESWLTTRLAQVMKLSWVLLYRNEGGVFVCSRPAFEVPQSLRGDCALALEMKAKGEPARLGQLEGLGLLDETSAIFLEAVAKAGGRLLVPLVASQELYAFLVVGMKLSEEELTREELQLLRALANQGAVGFENARFLKEHARQLALEKELEIARAVQFSLIPQHIDAPPPWRVAARFIPAYQVGGDFYDVLPSPGNTGLSLVLGDVAGKSVAGAMLMVAAREALRSAALAAPGPAELLQLVNGQLYRREHRMILALAYLHLGAGGKLKYCLAGQPPPLKLRRDGEVEELPLPAARLPLGALAEAFWDEVEARLAPGELLLLYSDGLVDAQGPDGEAFGEERLKDLLRQGPREPEAAVAAIIDTVRSFSGDGQAFDDVTVMAVKWEGEA